MELKKKIIVSHELLSRNLIHIEKLLNLSSVMVFSLVISVSEKNYMNKFLEGVVPVSFLRESVN